MASSRVKCTLSVEQCELLLKGHVASLDDQIYKNEDQEVVVKHYLQFLCACAQYTSRLNSKVAQQAAVSIFGIPPTGAKMFAEAMVQALQYCMIKGKCASSGKKLSDSVKSVVLSFRCRFLGCCLKSPAGQHHHGQQQQQHTEAALPEEPGQGGGKSLCSSIHKKRSD